MTNLLRITTVPVSLLKLIEGQPGFMQLHGFNVSLACAEGKETGLVEEQTGIKVKRLPFTRRITPLADLWALWITWLYVLKTKPRIVHTHTPKAGLIGMLAAWLARVPVRMHTIAGLPLMETTGGKRKLLNTVEKITCGCATRVYPNSFGLKDIMVSEGLCNPDKLKVIGNGSSNGIDTSYFSREALSVKELERVRKEYGIGDDNFVYIFIGRLVKDKGLNELIEAFARLHSKNSHVKLILVGDEEPELDPLKQSTREVMLSHPDIHLTGFREDVRPYMAVSHALAFPSYREGFPNVPMQAGAMGLPSIVTDINGCNEIITDELNGLIIPPKDSEALMNAMTRLMNDKDLYKKLTSNARESIVSRYDQQTFWKLLKQEYDDQLERAGINK